jgi:hypothetical protein
MKKNIFWPRGEEKLQGIKCKEEEKRRAATYKLNDTPPLFSRMAPIGINE